MASSKDKLAGQLLLTQSFLTRIVVAHTVPTALLDDLKKAVESSIAVTSIATNGASEMTTSIQEEAQHWRRILEEQIARAN